MNILNRRVHLARKAYGTALFELYLCFKAHEECALPPTLGDAQQMPDLFDGMVGGENFTLELITAYLTLMQAERDEAAGRAVEDEPIDRLVAAFDEWVTI